MYTFLSFVVVVVVEVEMKGPATPVLVWLAVTGGVNGEHAGAERSDLDRKSPVGKHYENVR
jgi:hypothetical protein